MQHSKISIRGTPPSQIFKLNKKIQIALDRIKIPPRPRAEQLQPRHVIFAAELLDLRSIFFDLFKHIVIISKTLLLSHFPANMPPPISSIKCDEPSQETIQQRNRSRRPDANALLAGFVGQSRKAAAARRTSR